MQSSPKANKLDFWGLFLEDTNSGGSWGLFLQTVPTDDSRLQDMCYNQTDSLSVIA